MPCKDISEEYKLSLNDCESFLGIWGFKNTCGKNIELETESLPFVEKPMTDILEARFDSNDSIFSRKFLIATKSILCEYLGFEKPFEGVNCDILGIDFGPNGSADILANLELLIPVDEIKACGNSCGKCAR